MEELTLSPSDTPSSRLRELAARRAAHAYETVAWRAPSVSRFDGRPANDFIVRSDVVVSSGALPVGEEPMPRWLVILIGALVAALMGALLGGMMAV